MCLDIDDTLTKKLRRKGDCVICYKYFSVMGDRVFSPFMERPLFLQRGWYISNREHIKLDEAETENLQVSYGVHVFLSKRSCLESLKNEGNCSIAVPCKCYKKHLVAAGTFDEYYNSAVYMRVKISQKDIDKAMEKYKKGGG